MIYVIISTLNRPLTRDHDTLCTSIGHNQMIEFFYLTIAWTPDYSLLYTPASLACCTLIRERIAAINATTMTITTYGATYVINEAKKARHKAASI